MACVCLVKENYKSQGDEERFVGHSAHVTNVVFTFDDKYVVSTGGHDTR